MANKIVFDYNKMATAVTSIEGIAKSFETAGKTFNDDFNAAIASWEGDSKDKLKTLIDGDVNTLLFTSIPAYVTGFATLLKENSEQMKKADTAIADSIPASLSNG